MNKTDKILYGGFAVVALASLTAMLVFVFFPPKQAEETVGTPKIEQPTMETASTVEEPTPTKAPITTLMRTEIKSSSAKKNSKRVQNTSKNKNGRKPSD